MKRVPFEMEFLFRASPSMLYKFLTTPSCLIRWFCERVEIVNGKYTFYWGSAEEVAHLLQDIEDERVRFVWEDGNPDEFLEFRFAKADITDDTVLEIHDFCDANDRHNQQQLWTTQMEALRHAIGG